MTLSQITYNDYTFPDRSKFHVTEQYGYDPSDRVVEGTRFLLRVETIICNEAAVVTTPANYYAAQYDCKDEVHEARQKLSKPGKQLLIEHNGFAPRWDINGAYSVIRDISWGPKPRVLSWEPIGDTASCEVVWECEFFIPICNGDSNVQFNGLSSLSYGIGYSYDRRGYTTRRISGEISIALSMSENNNGALIDSIENYRDKLILNKPKNFAREVSWDVSPDKRTAQFTIVDSEISSPNAWPPGVVNITAQHRVGWTRSSLNRINNTISATIEMAPDQLKARAWLIFRDIVQTRLQYAMLGQAMVSPGEDNSPPVIFLNTFDVVEELYENRVSFQIGYYFLNVANLDRLFKLTGLFQAVSWVNQPSPTWDTWDETVKHLQPFQGNGTDRGLSDLKFDNNSDKPITLCGNVQASPQQFNTRLPQPGTAYYGYGRTFVNQRPPTRKSWIKFDAMISYKSNTGARQSVTVTTQDVERKLFDPSDANLDGATVGASRAAVKRFVENHAEKNIIVYSGYAERAGYPVPEPGKITIGGKTLTPVGIGEFRTKYLGDYFGQPKYGASWRQEYMLDEIPQNLGQQVPTADDDGLLDAFIGISPANPLNPNN